MAFGGRITCLLLCFSRLIAIEKIDQWSNCSEIGFRIKNKFSTFAIFGVDLSQHQFPISSQACHLCSIVFRLYMQKMNDYTEGLVLNSSARQDVSLKY